MKTQIVFLLVAMLTYVGTTRGMETVFFDDFEAETEPTDPRGFTENYDSFENWDVLGTGVDLIGSDFFPTQGIVVDLDGTSGSMLVTKEEFLLPAGTYDLSFDLGGPFGGTVQGTVVVTLGNVFSDQITINQGAPFEEFEREITITQPTTGKLSFTDLGADSNGALLDNVTLTSLTPDILPPEIAGSTSQSILWPPNHKMQGVHIQFEVSDNESSVSELFDSLQVFASSSEPDSIRRGDRTGDVHGFDGFTNPVDVTDLFELSESGLFEGTLDLRAERFGDGDERAYTIEATVADAAGNEGVFATTVVVPHDRSHAVPEPNSWTPCFVGIALVGGMLRSRRRR